jgi:hypothetical protein
MSEQTRPRGNPAWRRGGPSPNPGGRPKSGITEALRARVSPDEIATFLLSTVNDPAIPILTRIRTAEIVLNRCEGMPLARSEILADVTNRTADPYAHLSDDELAQLKAEKQALLDAPHRPLLGTSDAYDAGEPCFEAEMVVDFPAPSPSPVASSADSRTTPASPEPHGGPAQVAIAAMADRAERRHRRRSAP